MPGFYQEGEYDLSGTIVGVVEKAGILDGRGIEPGDAVIGVASSGLHTNGYSLARKIFFEQMKLKPRDVVRELGGSLGRELLKVHVSYGPLIRAVLEKFNRPRRRRAVKGMAHITGGGFIDNIPRVLPKKCDAVIRKGIVGGAAGFSTARRPGRGGGERALPGVQHGGRNDDDGGGGEGGRGAEIHPRARAGGAWIIGEIVRGPRGGANRLRETMNIFDELEWRGLVADCTDAAGIAPAAGDRPDCALRRVRSDGGQPARRATWCRCWRCGDFNCMGHHPIAVAGGRDGIGGGPERARDGAAASDEGSAGRTTSHA